MDVVQMLERLKEYGLSETRIAQELGICPSSVNKIRRGVVKNPLPSTLRGIELLYQIIVYQKSQLQSVNLPVPVCGAG